MHARFAAGSPSGATTTAAAIARRLTETPFDGHARLLAADAFALRVPLAAVVAVPVKDEALLLPRSLDALEAALRAAPGTGAVLVVNNTADGSARIVRAWASAARLPVLACEVRFAAPIATVAFARRLALDLAEALCRPDGVLLSTDADTLVPQDWIGRMSGPVGAGAALVAGGLGVDETEIARLPRTVRDAGLAEAALGAAYEAIWSRLGPGPCPLLLAPGGANMAIAASAYRAVGRLPTDARNEDRALGRAVAAAGLAIAAARDVVATTSCRLDARARDGMADALVERCRVADPRVDDMLLPLADFVPRALAAALATAPGPLRSPVARCLRLPESAIWQDGDTAFAVAARLAAILPPPQRLTMRTARVELHAARAVLDRLGASADAALTLAAAA